MNIWIITGEASGDDYGAGLARALSSIDPTMTIRGMGAEKMRGAGVDIMVDSTDLGIVGIVEVLRHLPFFARLMRDLVNRAASERPDAVVLIDYPGFNIRLAQRLKKIGIPVVYYISPQVWAWKKGRIPKIAAAVSRMLCIFPFEPEVYAGTGMPAMFVGHPLLQTLEPYIASITERDDNLVILLPGSRRSEYSRLMPVFMKTACALRARNPKLRFHIPLRNEQNIEAVKQIMAKEDESFDQSMFEFSAGDAREWMRRGAAGIAASGTVTVEATILELPLVVTYRLNPFTYWIGKRLVKLPFISITNLVMKKMVFEELLQDKATADNLSRALLDILPNGRRHDEVVAAMSDCVRQFGNGQDVAKNVAENVLETIRQAQS
ncbi:MAG: lipid-A-disaccharide synthase [Victivallales bacterium]|nr:lipid-A-disaccharide synthase [Victivallales bacterium]